MTNHVHLAPSETLDQGAWLSVLHGRQALRVASQDHVPGGRHSVFFNSMRPHSYRRIGEKPCPALGVSVP